MKTFALSCLITSFCFFAPATHAADDPRLLARAQTAGDKLVFIRCSPISKHEQVGSRPMRSSPRYQPDRLTDKALRKTYKDSNRHGYTFDAIIIESSGSLVVAIRFDSPSPDNNLGNVYPQMNKPVFIRNEPVAPYDIVVEYNFIKAPRADQLYMAELAVKKAYQKSGEFDAVIVNGDGSAKTIRYR